MSLLLVDSSFSVAKLHFFYETRDVLLGKFSFCFQILALVKDSLSPNPQGFMKTK
jgi:hypothetical protein